jgi:steroid delta-isomerase-like uncharacterized protein
MTRISRPPAPTTPHAAGMTRADVESMFARRQEAWDNLDSAALSQDYADNCVVDSPAGGGTLNGRSEVDRVRRAFFEAFPDLKVVTHTLLIDGDHVVQISTMEGTDIGGFMGMAPTGKTFTVPAVFFYEFRDGQIHRERRIYDFTGMLVQVGLLKAKPV